MLRRQVDSTEALMQQPRHAGSLTWCDGADVSEPSTDCSAATLLLPSILDEAGRRDRKYDVQFATNRSATRSRLEALLHFECIVPQAVCERADVRRQASSAPISGSHQSRDRVHDAAEQVRELTQDLC